MVDCTTILLLQPRGGARAMGTNTMALIQTCQIQAIRILYRSPGVTVPKGLAPSCTIRPWTGLGRILERCLRNQKNAGVQRLHWCPASTFACSMFSRYDSGYDSRKCNMHVAINFKYAISGNAHVAFLHDPPLDWPRARPCERRTYNQ